MGRTPPDGEGSLELGLPPVRAGPVTPGPCFNAGSLIAFGTPGAKVVVPGPWGSSFVCLVRANLAVLRRWLLAGILAAFPELVGGSATLD